MWPSATSSGSWGRARCPTTTPGYAEHESHYHKFIGAVNAALGGQQPPDEEKSSLVVLPLRVGGDEGAASKSAYRAVLRKEPVDL